MDDDVVREFIVESYENLDQVDRELVALEKAPGDVGRLSSVFRSVHTIKGTCGFFGFTKLESVAHVGENLLVQLRDGAKAMNSDIASALLAMVDALREILGVIEATGNDGDNNYQPLVDRLSALAQLPQSTSAAPPMSVDGTASIMTSESEPPISEETADVAIMASPALSSNGNGSAPTVNEDHEAVHEHDDIARFAEAATPANSTAESHGSPLSESNIRVDVALLDKLMNLVGELVLARNQIIQYSANHHDSAFISTSQRLNLITTELQEGVMKTRMQPIGNIWNKFPRVVRDLEASCGKQVRVDMEGQSTELDKTIIEAIKDPLTHIVRNSVDHGIELPSVRTSRGKPARGRLSLRAFHEGGQVIIEISDDGGGIDPERVKAKALERGLITTEHAARMNEREALKLIFLPGFSTAEKVTNISGRGVGMDVVKTNIERIGGVIDMQSTKGVGTSIRIKIPLTLAIIPALIVAVGGDRFAIPQASLLELVRLEGEAAMQKIEMIHNAPVYRLRGNLLPIVYLHEQLQVEQRQKRDDVVNIVVLRADDRSFGMIVDAIHDTEEIVVKPLGKQLKELAVFAGATIMGDGKVALILDVLGIAQMAGVVGEARESSGAGESEDAVAVKEATRTLLICGVGGRRQIAIPLEAVDRLEDIAVDRIEYSDNREVIQYRDQIMPLAHVGDLLGKRRKTSRTDESLENADTLKVVVHSLDGQRVGLVVDKIIDIVETSIDLVKESRRRGVVGSIVVQGRVTDLVDVSLLLAAASFEPAGELALA